MRMSRNATAPPWRCCGLLKCPPLWDWPPWKLREHSVLLPLRSCRIILSKQSLEGPSLLLQSDWLALSSA